MDAKGLQRGNWIAYNSSGNIKYMQVLEIHEEKLVCRKGEQQLLLYYDSSNLELIPLTPEILEKAGFGKTEFGQFDLEKESFSWDPYRKKMILDAWDGVDLDHVEYLHQLQNIYPLIEGEELQIEL